MVNLYLQQHSVRAICHSLLCLIVTHFLSNSFMCVFQQMYLNCFKTKILVHCCLIGSDVCFKTTWGKKGGCLLLPLGFETGQKAIGGPVYCQWSVWCIYTACWNGSSYHVTCENTYIKAFFAKIPPPNKIQPQQGV